MWVSFFGGFGEGNHQENRSHRQTAAIFWGFPDLETTQFHRDTMRDVPVGPPCGCHERPGPVIDLLLAESMAINLFSGTTASNSHPPLAFEAQNEVYKAPLTHLSLDL